MAKKISPSKELKADLKKSADEIESMVRVEEGKAMLEPVTGKDVSEMVWVCTPVFKVKGVGNPYDIELSIFGGKVDVIRIVREGSNRIRLCARIPKADLPDAMQEAKAQAEKEKPGSTEYTGNPGKNKKVAIPGTTPEVGK